MWLANNEASIEVIAQFLCPGQARGDILLVFFF